jgi:hypothetical protein
VTPAAKDQLELGQINVTNVYKWLGDPRFGSMTLYVDGHRAGKISPGSTFNVLCIPNVDHVVRVKLWWFLSPRLKIMVEPGGSVQLNVDIEKTKSILFRMWYMLIHPLTCLSIEIIAP